MKQTDRVGVIAAQSIFVQEFGWIFREQFVSDFGIDAQVEVTQGEKPTGRLLALQVKAGASFFKPNKTGNFVYYGEGRHLRYWERHSLPVAIVMHNPESGLTLWQRISDGEVEQRKNDRWSIEIPSTNVLNADAMPRLIKGVSDITAQRRLSLQFDLPLMKEFEGKEVAFVVEEWPNKSLGFRSTHVHFNGVENDSTYFLERWCPTHSLGEYMAEVWPWLSFGYLDEEPHIDGSDECVGHEIYVELNDIGKAFLTLERFYEDGAEYPEEPTIVDDDGEQFDVSEEEYYEWLKSYSGREES